MFIRRRKTVMKALAVAAALFVLATQIGAFGPGQGAVKLEGAWIAKVISYENAPVNWPVQWSYVLAPDASGRSASIHGSVDVAFPQNPDLLYDLNTPLIGEIVQTGPHTAAFNAYWYSIKKAAPFDQIVFIGRSWGEARFTGPGNLEATHHFELYLPNADTNGDGLPEGSPIIQFVLTTQETRIPPPER